MKETTESTDSTEPAKQIPVVRDKSQPEALKDSIIGKPLDRLSTSKLPIKRVILQRWRAHRLDSNLAVGQEVSNQDIASEITTEVIEIWDLAGIPTKRKDKVKDQVVKLIVSVSGIMRSKHAQKTDTDQDPLKSFAKSLNELFDVSPTDLKHKLLTGGNPYSWNEDWQFYLNQCKVPQVGAIVGKDKKLADLVARVFVMVQSLSTLTLCNQGLTTMPDSWGNPYIYSRYSC